MALRLGDLSKITLPLAHAARLSLWGATEPSKVPGCFLRPATTSRGFP